MSSKCLIKNSEYRTKLAQSGIPEPVFYAYAGVFMDEHGRLPNLDELPHSDSIPYLTKTLQINDNAAKTENILAITGTENIQDATIALNDTYSDLEVRLVNINEDTIVNTTKRPSEYSVEEDVEIHEVSDDINIVVVFNQLFDKLRNLYGINIIPITDNEVSNYIGDVQNVSAFIHEGNIYINTDLADLDAPIHEMTHMLMGAIRFKNPQLYQQLINIAEDFSSLQEFIKNNPNRTYSDILEEAFVQETGKYLSGMDSELNKLDESLLYEMHYNFKRLLDSALMGQYSVKSVPDSKLYNMSLLDLARLVNSQTFEINSSFSLNDAMLHRMLSNKKSDLMKKGDLREEC